MSYTPPNRSTAVAAPQGGNLSSDNRNTLEAMLRRPETQAQIKSFLGNNLEPGRFVTLALKTVNKVPELARCNIDSVVVAVLDAASLQLEIDGALGQAWVVPYKGRAQFQIGYKGYNELMRRTGQLRPRHCGIVYDGDDWDWNEGTRELKHKAVAPSKRNKNDKGSWIPVAVYSLIDYVGKQGQTVSEDKEWMWIEEVDAIQARSPAGRSGPWITDWAEMAKKTVRRRHAKRMPMGTEAQRMLAREEMFDAGIVDDETPREVEAEVVPDKPDPLKTLMDQKASRNAQAASAPKEEPQAQPKQEASPMAAEPEPEPFLPSEPTPPPKPREVHGIPIVKVRDHYANWMKQPINAREGHPFFGKTWEDVVNAGKMSDTEILKALRDGIAYSLAQMAGGKQASETAERAALALEQIHIQAGGKATPEAQMSAPWGE